MTVTPREGASLAVVVEAVVDVDVDLAGAVVPDAEGDEAGEPEEHGQGVEAEHGDGVGEGGEEARGEGEVDEDDEGPDGGEDHEAVFGGDDDVVPQGCDWGWEGGVLVGYVGGGERGWGKRTVTCESEDYDCEESLDGAKSDEYNVEHGCL